jgi:hypothetical protein
LSLYREIRCFVNIPILLVHCCWAAGAFGVSLTFGG